MASPSARRIVPALALDRLLTLGDETDEHGRLLLEDSADERAQRRAVARGIDMTAAVCPFDDTPSRLNGQMNVPAYEALRSDLAGVLDGFAWLRQQEHPGTLNRAGQAQLLYRISYLGITIPTYLFRRAVEPVPPHGRLPSVVASLFKASRGLFSVAVGLLNADEPSTAMIADEVVAFADRNGHLRRSGTDRVCAAPTRLIERTIAVILNGGADPQATVLANLAPFPILSDLVRVQDDLSQSLSIYRSVLDRLSGARPGSRPQDLFDLMVPGTSGTFGQLTEAMVAHAGDAQARLNRLLGREGRPPSLGYRQLLELL